MLNKLSATGLITTIIGLLATGIVLVVAGGVIGAWNDAQSASRILQVVDASDQAFVAMVQIRTDRNTTARTWSADETLSPTMDSYLRALRDPQMAALHRLLPVLESLDFPRRDQLLPALRQTVGRLETLQTEYWAGIKQPIATRRKGLSAEYLKEGTDLQTELEQISGSLFGSIKTVSPFISEMMEVKQLAWMARDNAGNSSLLISMGLAAGKVAPDVQVTYTGYLSASKAMWAGIDDVIAGIDLPPRFSQRMKAAKDVFFAPDYLATQQRLLTALLDGSKPSMTADEWSRYTVPKLGAMLDVASAALTEAHDHAVRLRGDARWSFALRLALAVAALALSLGGLLLIRRHVLRPLRVLQQATLRLAEGDLSAEAPYADRHDEIGALAGALTVFRRHASEKAAAEAAQQQQQQGAEARRVAVEGHINRFDASVRDALDSLGGASADMARAADQMTGIAETGNQQAQAAAAAAEDASANVAGIAAASEELTASIVEISRQVAQAAQISQRAVEETRQTDATVHSLAESAGRIGEVVRLISDIASQTNLLALNATIEAARAGEAGKGFAVVASEVKSLATQTAKATEDIAAQIAGVRTVTEDAVQAIKRIGATINEVSSVATAIAAGVEEQGSSTQEIARNAQEAARRTRDLSETVGRVRQGADSTGATARSVKTASGAVLDSTERLRGQVGSFLGEIRAA
jgi:methyl-accepting chemotaxis protein